MALKDDGYWVTMGTLTLSGGQNVGSFSCVLEDDLSNSLKEDRMYLTISYTSPVFGKIENTIGPFTTKAERNQFKEAWKRITGFPAVFLETNYSGKRKGTIPVDYARLLLTMHKKLGTKKKRDK